MSDNEYEKFEINDYDLENEFNPNRNRRPTRHQQIYGIWADDSDHDDGAGTSRRGGRWRAAADYSAPVSFVAGGVQQAGDKKEKLKADQKSDESDDEKHPGLGGGDNTSSESDGEAVQMAGFRTKATGAAQKMPGNIGNWEKHTSGIGSKLLLKMGYEPGRGLGKNLQGISTPIQAAVRKGRGAIGAYGPEVGQTLADQKKLVKKLDTDEKETKEFQEKLQQWKRDPAKGKKFRYFTYKSPEDLLSEKGKKGSFGADKISSGNNKLGQVTVIDMTGPERRVLSGYHALGQSRAAADELIYDSASKNKQSSTTNFALPELMHNLNLIVDMCETDIISNDQAQKSAQDREVTLKREKDNLEKIVELEAKHIVKLEEVESLVEGLVNPKDTLTLEAAERVFLILQTDYECEFEDFGLSDLVPGIIAPLVSTKLKDWRPLDDPTCNIDILKRWKEILRQTDISSSTIFEPYSVLVWSGIVPSIRQSISTWNPKSYQPMVALLDAWAPLFPSRIFDNILEQIATRLAISVEEWDPLTDTMPIHIWIHPWTGLLGDKLNEKIFPTIREKLGNALKAWTPQDRSALAMLRPWKNVFHEGDMQAFTVKHILPKLQAVLNEFIVNPLQQDLEPWNVAWEWHEILTTQTMSQLLDKYFFPRWMQTLVIWLNQNPNLEQVARWYSGWKNLMSEDVQKQPAVKEHLRRALELMHRASTGAINLPEPSINLMQNPIISQPALIEMQAPPPPTIEFKELVSQKCAERGIIFAPMPGRREMGKQVYRLGKLFCYIDRSVIMMTDGSLRSWSPASLATVFEKAVLGLGG